MNKNELKAILSLHRKWILDAGGERADLSGADLIDANLSDANLRGANLRYANLRGADLSDANLRNANLRGADLRYANLSDANLSDANLSGANLRYADLGGANLRGTNLSDASCGLAVMGSSWWCMDSKYAVHICKEYVEIGCEKHTVSKWESFTDEQISEMDEGALDWWNDFKTLIIKKGKEKEEK